MRTAMMAITTSSSISMTPCRLLVVANRNMDVPVGLCARAVRLPALWLVLLPFSSVPDLDFPFAPVAAAGRQAPAIGAEGDPQDRARVAPEQRARLAGSCVPEPHGLVPACRGEPAA